MTSITHRSVATRESDARWTPKPGSATPLVLLFLALATVFLFGDRGQPVHGSPGGYYEAATWDHMTVAQNLSPEHAFSRFRRSVRTGEDDLSYAPYNRFPVLGYALIKLATLPFPDDISARLSAARTLMLVLFAAATLAYLALCRLAGNRWTASAACYSVTQSKLAASSTSPSPSYSATCG